MKTAIVITNKCMGIYLGNCLGLGFWSNMDTAGQSHAVTFPDKFVARAHVMGWDENSDPDNYDYREVQIADRDYATAEELLRAGLPATWVRPLQIETTYHDD